MNTRPINTNKGAPGGWGTCSLKQELTNSPQSHKAATSFCGHDVYGTGYQGNDPARYVIDFLKRHSF